MALEFSSDKSREKLLDATVTVPDRLSQHAGLKLPEIDLLAQHPRLKAFLDGLAREANGPAIVNPLQDIKPTVEIVSDGVSLFAKLIRGEKPKLGEVLVTGLGGLALATTHSPSIKITSSKEIVEFTSNLVSFMRKQGHNIANVDALRFTAKLVEGLNAYNGSFVSPILQAGGLKTLLKAIKEYPTPENLTPIAHSISDISPEHLAQLMRICKSLNINSTQVERVVAILRHPELGTVGIAPLTRCAVHIMSYLPQRRELSGFPLDVSNNLKLTQPKSGIKAKIPASASIDENVTTFIDTLNGSGSVPLNKTLSYASELLQTVERFSDEFAALTPTTWKDLGNIFAKQLNGRLGNETVRVANSLANKPFATQMATLIAKINIIGREHFTHSDLITEVAKHPRLLATSKVHLTTILKRAPFPEVATSRRDAFQKIREYLNHLESQLAKPKR